MGEAFGLTLDGWGLLLAVLGFVIAGVAYVIRSEMRVRTSFEELNTSLQDIRRGFVGVDEQNGMLLKSQAERDLMLREAFSKLQESLADISNRAQQNSRLQLELIGTIQKLNEYIVEADRRSTQEHTELLTLMRTMRDPK